MRILANSEELTPISGVLVRTAQATEEPARRGRDLDLPYMRDGPYHPRHAGFCDSMQEVPALDLGVHRGERPAGDLNASVVARARLGISDEPFLVMYFGRVEPAKGIDARAGLDAGSRPVDIQRGGLGQRRGPIARDLGRDLERPGLPGNGQRAGETDRAAAVVPPRRVGHPPDGDEILRKYLFVQANVGRRRRRRRPLEGSGAQNPSRSRASSRCCQCFSTRTKSSR